MDANLINERIEVLWRGEGTGQNDDGGIWYTATVSEYDASQDPLSHLLTYDDGDREWCDLNTLEWRALGDTNDEQHEHQATIEEATATSARFSSFTAIFLFFVTQTHSMSIHAGSKLF